MSRIIFDGIIEAVRYTPSGQIDLVRVYEKRWKVYSDVVLMDRTTLVDRLSKGSQFVTGRRKLYVANMFETGKKLHLSNDKDPIVTTKDQAGSQDFLANVPIF